MEEEIKDVEKEIEKIGDDKKGSVKGLFSFELPSKSQIKKWLGDYENLVLLAVIIFAIFLRLYYFFLTKNQPFWWDEASYGIIAKSFISSTWDTNPLVISERIIRPLLLSFVWAGLMLVNIPEAGSRFILEIIPSIISVFFVYLIGKEIYNKRVGIISAFIFSVLWIDIFYSMRILTDTPCLTFMFASIYYFILAIKKEFNYKYFLISLFLLSIGTLIRYLIGMVFVFYLIILIFSKQLYLNKKKFWYSGILGTSPLIIAVILNYIISGDIFSRFIGANLGNASEQISKPIAYNLINYIPIYLMNVFYYSFIFGLIIILFELIVGFNYIFKNERMKGSLLLIFILVAYFSFFIFYLRSADDRYFLPAALTMCIFAGVGIDWIYSFLKKYNQIIAVVILFVILFFGAQAQLKQTDNIIKGKIDSFSQIKDGLLWLKQNTPANSDIVAIGLDPYAIYYADINITSYVTENDTERIEKADYLVLHAFPPPNFLQSFVQQNQSNWQPINAFYFDKQNQQPGFVIFKNVGK